MPHPIDKSNMRQVILDFPKQFGKGLEISKDVEIEKPINKIVISGMGGSALPGDLVKLYLKDDIDIPIEVSRNYYLTTPVNRETLIFCISFSGNTEETLASYEEAKKEEVSVVIITYDGKLEEIAKKDSLPLVKLIKESPTFQPRSATGYMFAAIINVLINSGIVSERHREEIEILDGKLQAFDFESQSKDLAKKLKGKIPLIYASDRFKALARIWKIKFNENSKTQAFWNYFPELNHNEMVGFTDLQGKYQIIILKDKDDHPRVEKRMAITAELLKEKGLETTIIDIQGQDLLTKIFSTLMLGDWISYYLALEYGIDPTPVKMVEDFKKRMAE